LCPLYLSNTLIAMRSQRSKTPQRSGSRLVRLCIAAMALVSWTACTPAGLLSPSSAMHRVTCDGMNVPSGVDLNAILDQAQLADVLCLAPGTYKAPIRITASVTLAANGEGPVIIDANGEGTSIMIDAPSGEVALRGLTIIGGRAETVGGGVSVTPGTNVSIQRCVLSGNRGGSEGGAALYASGAQVRIDQTRIVGNQSEVGGSAILIDRHAQVSLRSSLIAENQDVRSAPIRILDGAQLSVFGSTIVNNSASWGLELVGISARPPSLRISGSILSHQGGPLLWVIEGLAEPTVRIQQTLLHGDASRISSARNFMGDPQLNTSYRPSPDSLARGKIRGLPASWPSRDLLGVMRSSTPALGAIE
jgi:hypothetical protein